MGTCATQPCHCHCSFSCVRKDTSSFAAVRIDIIQNHFPPRWRDLITTSFTTVTPSVLCLFSDTLLTCPPLRAPLRDLSRHLQPLPRRTLFRLLFHPSPVMGLKHMLIKNDQLHVIHMLHIFDCDLRVLMRKSSSHFLALSPGVSAAQETPLCIRPPLPKESLQRCSNCAQS